MEEKFTVVLKNGKEVLATPIIRLKVEETDITYQYYSIEDDENSNSVSIIAQRVVVEDNQEVLKDLINEDERQVAYELFSETYKKIKKENE